MFVSTKRRSKSQCHYIIEKQAFATIAVAFSAKVLPWPPMPIGMSGLPMKKKCHPSRDGGEKIVISALFANNRL